MNEAHRPVTAVSLSEVQSVVAERLAAVRQTMEDAVTREVPLLAQAARHLLAMKGKMFRPTLVLLASAAADAPNDNAVIVAAVVELVHLATLVHDDTVDHSALRRGMPTINALFSDQVSVIMGDFLYSTALTRLVEIGDMRLIRSLVDASTRMTVGELRQMSVVDPLDFGEDDYEFLIRAKTASLIAAACEVGAFCGAERHAAALRRYGDALGMTFQIVDDLMDYTEESATTGKPSGLDLREHKVTLPMIGALKSMSAASRGRIAAFFGDPSPSEEDASEVASIVIDAGGLEYARARAEAYAERAEAELRNLPESPARDALGAAIFYVMERHA